MNEMKLKKSDKEKCSAHVCVDGEGLPMVATLQSTAEGKEARLKPSLTGRDRKTSTHLL